ncbi:MAG: response regulator [Deltaproteobacteria bacterium]|nr:response regulator [Deltaproteobacteria bacterium]
METIQQEAPRQISEETVPTRVVVVDDDPPALQALKRTLDDRGYVVCQASTGEDGLDIVRRDRLAVIVADVRMPHMNGIEFLCRARAMQPETYRILVTGHLDVHMALEAVNRAGVSRMFTKPWDPNELRRVVDDAVRAYERTKERERLSGQLLATCEDLGATAVELEREVQVRTESLLHGLINALDYRDTETKDHSRRVAKYSRLLALNLHVPGDLLSVVQRGALLHDVGKIGVSDAILLKPGKLTEDEWVEMRRHSEYGHDILEGIPFLKEARKIVLEHHERFDGKGYPQGKSGHDICLGARIFAVIDTYDAITSDRPYRKAQPHGTATEEIRKMSGTQFDPEVAEAWLAIPESEIAEARRAAEEA